GFLTGARGAAGAFALAIGAMGLGTAGFEGGGCGATNVGRSRRNNRDIGATTVGRSLGTSASMRGTVSRSWTSMGVGRAATGTEAFITCGVEILYAASGRGSGVAPSAEGASGFGGLLLKSFERMPIVSCPTKV